VAHLRRLPFCKDLTVEQARTWGMVESLRRAKKDLPMFVSDLKRQGWQINKLLLSSAEKVTTINQPYLFILYGIPYSSVQFRTELTV